MVKNNDNRAIEFLRTGIRNISVRDFNMEVANENELDINRLLDFTLCKDPVIGFRAAWFLEHIILKKPSLITDIYERYISTLEKQNNWGAIRSLTKIAMLASRGKYAIDHRKSECDILVELCFRWLIDPKCPVAVLVNCLDILANFSHTNDWIKQELREQIDYLLLHPTPALVSRTNKILRNFY